LRSNITTDSIDRFWGQMKHPPLSYLGNKFQYRTPDGSYNVTIEIQTFNPSLIYRLTKFGFNHQNVMNPDLGKAGTPYAKSIPGKTALHGAKPDPGDLFDSEDC
jgi:hypothetical protein